MTKRKHAVTAQAVVEFSRNGLRIMAEKYGGDCTLNEVRVMTEIICAHFEGRTCSVTTLHKGTGIPMPTVSRAVANLQRDGWLSDQPDPEDGRKRLISFGPRSEQSTPDDIEGSIKWIDNFCMHGLPD